MGKTPLTRGTGNHTGPTVSSGTGGTGGRGDSRPLEIHNHIEVGGREFKKVITQVALDDFRY